MFKKFKSVSEVSVGDVVCLEKDTGKNAGYCSFQTCVVTKFSKEWGVHLARPHVKVTTWGTVFTATEDFCVQPERFVSEFVAFTTGPTGRVENRVS